MIVSSNLRCNIARNNGIMNLEVLSEAQQHFKKVTRWIFYLLRNQWYSSVRQTSANQRKNIWLTPCLKLQELMSTIKTTQKCHFYKHLCILWLYTAKTVTLKYISIFLVVLYLKGRCSLYTSPAGSTSAHYVRHRQYYFQLCWLGAPWQEAKFSYMSKKFNFLRSSGNVNISLHGHDGKRAST